MAQPLATKPSVDRQVWVGLDAFKMLPPLVGVLLNPSLILEPIVQVRVRPNLRLSAQLGYASVRRDSAYRNLLYRCQGAYLKLGFVRESMDFDATDPLAIAWGMNLTGAAFRETNRVVLRGRTFADLDETLVRQRYTAGVEFFLNMVWRPGGVWQVVGQARLGVLPVSPNRRDPVPTYYIPGSGVWGIELPPLVTGGLTVQVLYQLR